MSSRLPVPGDEPDDLYAYTPIADDDNKDDAKSRTRNRVNDTCSRKCSRATFRYRYALWFLGIFATFVLYIVFFNVGWSGYGRFWLNPDGYSGPDDPSEDTKTIVLLGDSLINRPFQRFDLGGMIRRRLSDYPMVIWNYGADGSTIASSYNRLGSALSHNPDALILFWDSDASDVDESVLNSTQVTSLRANYMTTLRLVVNTTLSYPTIKYMAIAGPGVYGSEGPLFAPKRFDGKTDVFNAYREMNKVISAEYDVDYIDVRQSLLTAVPFYWVIYKWWISIDGEHLNYRGSIIFANLAAGALGEWLNGK